MGPVSDLKWQLIACLLPKPSKPRLLHPPILCCNWPCHMPILSPPCFQDCYIPKIKDKIIDTLLPCSPFSHPELWGRGTKMSPLQNPFHLGLLAVFPSLEQ